jgi:hypothetical protein
MATIFQIRRGTTSATLSDGELYLNKGVGSLQISSGSNNPITLLPLNAPVIGDVNLIGNFTASNAYFSGDLTVAGDLTLGDVSGDTINAVGVFTSNLVPGTTNTYNLGSNTKSWNNVYASNISASFVTASLQEGYTWVGNSQGRNQAFATSSLSTFRQNVSVIGTNTNAAAFVVYVLTASLVLTLPSSPTIGDWIKISNLSNTTTCILGRNGTNIMGLAENLLLDDAQASFEIIYSGAAYGWVVIGAN